MRPTSRTPTARARRFIAATGCMMLAVTAAGVGAFPASASSLIARAHSTSRPVHTAAGAGKAKTPTRALVLSIGQAAPAGGYTTFANSGYAAVRISVVTDDGGALVDGRPRVHPTIDRAVRYPHYASGPDAPHAVIQIVDRRGPDDLDPGLLPFRFGADFNLDQVSEDTEFGGRDNGDNLLQRGLFNQPSQYKLQIDHRVPTCRVKGSLGAVAVSSTVRPVPGKWYRVRCLRNGDQLTIVVKSWNQGSMTALRQSTSGPIGVVSPTTRTVPVSVGGKLSRRGVVQRATDQFNGRVDNVIIRVGA
jgi:hypothetical protein